MVVGEFTTESDLVVIGGGPGGCAAALRAAELGIETTLVDAGTPSGDNGIGGTWLHAGLMTKELLSITSLRDALDAARSLGVASEPFTIDLEPLRAMLRERARLASERLEARLLAAGVVVMHGHARFDDSRRLTVAGGNVSRLKFRRAIIATGAATQRSPLVDADHPRVLSPVDAARLEHVPASLCVLGGTPMALELATVYATLGTAVTIVNPLPGVLRDVDGELITMLLDALRERVTVLDATSITRIDDTGTQFQMHGDDGTTVDAECILVATGREPADGGLDLHTTGVQRGDDGWITVDDHMATTDPRIYAIGDAIAAEGHASSARMQGRTAAEAVAGWNTAFDARAIPRVVFTTPPLAWCGLTARGAADAGYQDVDVIEHRWVGPGLAASADDTPDGMVHLVLDRDTGLILGLGVIGAGAPAFIGEATLAIEMGAVLDDLAAVVHAHPAGAVFGRAAEIGHGPHA